MKEILKDKTVEAYSHKKERTPSMIYISLDEKCNENCAFCVVKGDNVGKFGSMKIEEAKKIIKYSAEHGARDIDFTGGEPTLRNDLPEIVQYANKFEGIKSTTILTNGTRLADEKYFHDLTHFDKESKVTFSVSLHSHKEKVSELLTQTKGTFKKTIAGIKNAIKNEKTVSIYQVITTKNYRDLPEFANFLLREFPQIKYITFAYPFPQGNALQNEWLNPKFSLLRPYLIKALEILERNQFIINIASCGQFPLCAIPGFEEKVIGPLVWSEENISGVIGEKSFHEFEMMSDDWVDEYKNKNQKCQSCLLNCYCQGFWKKYIELYKYDGLLPVNIHNFTGNKVETDLNSTKSLNNLIKQIVPQKMNLIILNKYDQKYLDQLSNYLKRNKVLTLISYQNSLIFP